MGKSMCQLLNPYSCHPSFLLTHLSLSHQSTTTLKPSIVSWGSYCWAVVCGRTASPCPHAHSTSRLFHFTWAGKTGCHSSSILVHPHAERVVLSSPHAQVGILHCFPHAASWKSGLRGMIYAMYAFSLLTCGYVYMFPPV